MNEVWVVRCPANLGRSDLKYKLIQMPRESDSEVNYGMKRIPLLGHPLYAYLGLRPALAQHTAEEHAVLKKWAAGRKSLVEIGVAEGVSAMALRESMAEDGTLHLIDPFHLSRVPALNFLKRTAHRAVESRRSGKVVWWQEFSHEVAKRWGEAIDFILIDGDHSVEGVGQDWNDWGRFIKPAGIVMFHDARLFEGGWTRSEYGPVKLVDRLFRESRTRQWVIVDEVHSMVVVQRR